MASSNITSNDVEQQQEEDEDASRQNAVASDTDTRRRTFQSSSPLVCALEWCLFTLLIASACIFGFIVIIPSMVFACAGLSIMLVFFGFCIGCCSLTDTATTAGREWPWQLSPETTTTTSTTKLTREEMQRRLVPCTTSSENQEGASCEICLVDLFVDDTTTLVVASPNPECTHVFHQECILQWLENKPTCPCCRAPYLKVEGNEEPTTTSPQDDDDDNSEYDDSHNVELLESQEEEEEDGDNDELPVSDEGGDDDDGESPVSDSV